MQIAIRAILSKQFVGEKNAAIDMYDVSTGATLKVSFQNGRLPETAFHDESAKNLILEGVEVRSGKNGLYLICTNIVSADAPKGAK